MNIKLKNEQIMALQNKNKIYSFLNGEGTRTTFRVGNGKFTFILSNDSSVLETTVEAETSGNDIVSFNMEYSKWLMLLQKFSSYGEVDIDVSEGILKISTSESYDKGVYSVASYEEFTNFNDSDTMLEPKRSDILKNGKSLFLTDELVSNFELMNTMFSIQSSGNTIGLDEDSIIYADGSVIVKTFISEPVPQNFFEYREDGKRYIFISRNILKLMSLLYRSNAEIHFSDTYQEIYWSDDDTEIIFSGQTITSELPSDDEYNSYTVFNNGGKITMTSKVFKEALSFFDGVYEGSEWRPLTFEVSSENGLTIKYESQTTSLSKHVDGISCNVDSSFTLSSDILKNIVSKINDRFGSNADICIEYDDSSSGVYLTSSDTYESVLAKLEDM